MLDTSWELNKVNDKGSVQAKRNNLRTDHQGNWMSTGDDWKELNKSRNAIGWIQSHDHSTTGEQGI